MMRFMQNLLPIPLKKRYYFENTIYTKIRHMNARQAIFPEYCLVYDNHCRYYDILFFSELINKSQFDNNGIKLTDFVSFLLFSIHNETLLASDVFSLSICEVKTINAIRIHSHFQVGDSNKNVDLATRAGMFYF